MYRQSFQHKQIVEKPREFNVETNLNFVDIKKTFHTVDRNSLGEILHEGTHCIHILYENIDIAIDVGNS